MYTKNNKQLYIHTFFCSNNKEAFMNFLYYKIRFITYHLKLDLLHKESFEQHRLCKVFGLHRLS